jgi:hypothetical protein
VLRQSRQIEVVTLMFHPCRHSYGSSLRTIALSVVIITTHHHIPRPSLPSVAVPERDTAEVVMFVSSAIIPGALKNSSREPFSGSHDGPARR